MTEPTTHRRTYTTMLITDDSLYSGRVCYCRQPATHVSRFHCSTGVIVRTQCAKHAPDVTGVVAQSGEDVPSELTPEPNDG